MNTQIPPTREPAAKLEAVAIATTLAAVEQLNFARDIAYRFNGPLWEHLSRAAIDLGNAARQAKEIAASRSSSQH